MKSHAFFSSIDWESLLQNKSSVTPIFVPSITSQEDVGYFDIDRQWSLDDLSWIEGKLSISGNDVTISLSPNFRESQIFFQTDVATFDFVGIDNLGDKNREIIERTPRQKSEIHRANTDFPVKKDVQRGHSIL